MATIVLDVISCLALVHKDTLKTHSQVLFTIHYPLFTIHCLDSLLGALNPRGTLRMAHPQTVGKPDERESLVTLF
jgi:hypothetical protein